VSGGDGDEIGHQDDDDDEDQNEIDGEMTAQRWLAARLVSPITGGAAPALKWAVAKKRRPPKGKEKVPKKRSRKEGVGTAG